MQNLTQPVLRFIVVLFACISLLTTSACRKCQEPANPDCENYDPCYQLREVKADFKIFESYGAFGATMIEAAADTIIRGDIEFVAATEPGITRTYEWHIGSDPRVWTTSKVRLGFSVEGRVPVTLIVRGVPNTKCFPNDNGVDTIVKSFYVINADRVPWLNGNFHFRGADDATPLDTFDMQRHFNINNYKRDYTNFPTYGCNPQEENSPACTDRTEERCYSKWHTWYVCGTCCPCNYETYIYAGKNRKTVLVKYRKRWGESDTLSPYKYFRGKIIL